MPTLRSALIAYRGGARGSRRRLARAAVIGLSSLLLLSLSAGLYGASANAAQAHRSGFLPYLAIDQDFADPAIISYNGTYYAYSTNNGQGNIPIATATKLYGTWTPRQVDALPKLGAWASVGFTWAPDVSRLPNGQFVLYYTARDTVAGRQCVGAATASDPEGPFVPVGTTPLVCPIADGGAIDPSGFTDSDGKRYLAYKTDGYSAGSPTFLYAQQVADDGVTLIGPRIAMISNGPQEGPLVEAPYLVKRGNTYVLFYSYGVLTNSTYTEGYATAPSLAGPWQKSPTPVLSTALFDGRVVGPGGMSVLRTTGDDEIVFHGLHGNPVHRALYVDMLYWNGATPTAVGTNVSD